KPMSSCEQSSVVRVRMTVAYDGGPFHGFAENEGVVTVGATLRRAIERVLGHPVTMGVAGRTDRGVHAWGQVVTFGADPARLAPGAPEPSFVRAIRRAEWTRGSSATGAADGLLVFEIEAKSFCRQMVRSIVGTLVDVGLGRRRASEIPAILVARDRNAAGSVA